jgi:hypothetical protein
MIKTSQNLATILSGVEGRLATHGFGISAITSGIDGEIEFLVLELNHPDNLNLDRWRWLVEFVAQPSNDIDWVNKIRSHEWAEGCDHVHAFTLARFSAGARTASEKQGVSLHEVAALDLLKDSLLVHSLRLRFGDKSVIAPVLMDQELDESGRIKTRKGEFVFHVAPASTLTYPVTATYQADGKFNFNFDLNKIPPELRPGRYRAYKAKNINSKGSKCYANVLGTCHGRISGEHYISDSILKLMPGDGVNFSGHWGEKSISKRSLTANVLCQKHNSELSDIDNEAATFFNTIYQCTRGGIQGLKDVTTLRFDFLGRDIERWLLKVACGAIASGNHGGAIREVPFEWVEILFGKRPWPDYFVLFSNEVADYTVPERDHLSFEFRHDAPTGRLIAITSYFMCLDLTLVLGQYTGVQGIMRPKTLVFENGEREITVNLSW